MKSLFITGSNGLLGSKLVFAANGRYRITGLDLTADSFVRSVPMEYIQGDITDRKCIFKQISQKKPDVVLHTAAFTDVDACESHYDAAHAVNVDGAEHIADACKRLGIQLIHVSTDYVFNGNNGPYSEEDEPCPLSAYGRMKLESERIVQQTLPEAVIARTMVLFGYMPRIRKNFVTWLVEKLRNRDVVQIVNDQFGTPTYADDLAESLLVLYQKDARGIYHTAGPDCLSRHAFALQIADAFQLDASLISETTSNRFQQPAPRPMHSGLKTEKLTRDTGFTFMPLSQALLKLKEQMPLIG